MDNTIDASTENEENLDSSTVYDSSNPKHIKKKKQTTDFKQALIDDGLRLILSTQVGRAYINVLFERCHMYATSFHTNPSIMSRNEGERNIGLQILADVARVDQPAILTLMTELKDLNHD